MRIASAMRHSGAFWAIPIAFGLSVFVALSDFTIDTGYSVAGYATSSILLVLLGPLCATFLAFKFHPFPQFVRTLRPVRSGLSLFVEMWWPILLGFPLAGTLALVSANRSVPTSVADYEIFGVLVLATLACAFFGVFVARALPAPFAIPVSGALSFAWLALPGGGLSVTLRNMNSSFVGCCSADQQPSSRTVFGSLVVSGIIVIAGMACFLSNRWARQPRWSRIFQATTATAAAIACGQQVVLHGPGPLNLLAVQDRDSQMTCKSQGLVRACVWPENDSRVDLVIQLTERMNAGLNKYGLRPATQLSEGPISRDDVAFRAPAYSSEEDVAFSLAVGYGQAEYRCRGRDQGGYDLASVAFVGLAVGLSEKDLAARVGPDPVTAAQRKIGESPANARAWFRGAACDLNQSTS